VPLVAGFCLVTVMWGIYVRVFASDALVVYCAHDSVYSESILNRFSKTSGIPVKIKFDTEATKSLGLVELLVREKAHPRCDVFWNNELLGILRLKAQGVLDPYKGSGASRIPDKFKDPDGYWTGFAARSRVYIYNPKSVTSGLSYLSQPDISRSAIAKPLYGTTLTHYSVLWDQLGPTGLKAWHADLRERGIKEVNGNSMVKDLVASGACDVGFTDTDDFFLAKESGADVAMEPVLMKDSAICLIPNTVAVIAGSKRKSEAQQLVEFLLSEETELALANSSSRQIPLGVLEEDAIQKLPEEVKEMSKWTDSAVDLTRLGPASEACIQWLKTLDE